MTKTEKREKCMIYLGGVKIAHMSMERKPVMVERKLGSRVTVMLRGGWLQPKDCKEKQCRFVGGIVESTLCYSVFAMKH